MPTPPIASPSAVSPTAKPRLAPPPLRLDQPDDPGREIDDCCPQCYRRDQRFRDLSATPSPREVRQRTAVGHRHARADPGQSGTGGTHSVSLSVTAPQAECGDEARHPGVQRGDHR